MDELMANADAYILESRVAGVEIFSKILYIWACKKINIRIFV